MKKSILILWVLSLITFNGCGAIKGLMTYGTDPSLDTIDQVHALPRMNSVGFEWKKIEDHRIHGVNIYRGNTSQDRQNFKRIGTVGNRYATHFVDTHVKADSTYRYTFSTFAFGKESRRSEPIEVTTPSNRSSGKASTLIATFCPNATYGISSSYTLTLSSIWLGSIISMAMVLA